MEPVSLSLPITAIWPQERPCSARGIPARAPPRGPVLRSVSPLPVPPNKEAELCGRLAKMPGLVPAPRPNPAASEAAGGGGMGWGSGPRRPGRDLTQRLRMQRGPWVHNGTCGTTASRSR